MGQLVQFPILIFWVIEFEEVLIHSSSGCHKTLIKTKLNKLNEKKLNKVAWPPESEEITSLQCNVSI